MTMVSFDCRVLNQDQLSRFKGGVLDSERISMLEILCRCESTLHDVVADGIKVLVLGLQLMSVDGYKFAGGKGFGEVRNEKGSESNVEGKQGFYAMSHEEGGVSSGLVDCCLVCPEDVGHNCQPFRDVALASLHQRLLDGAVLMLNDTVGPRVVCRDPNVSNTIPACQPVQCRNKGGAIVSDDFLYHAPPSVLGGPANSRLKLKP